MARRSGKFYYKNERETLESLGLSQVPGSGSGWVHKEDGSNEYILAQLKSTDAQSFRVTKLDLDKLEYHANVEHKVPVFLVQFLQSNEIYALCKVDDIPDLAEYMALGRTNSTNKDIPIELETSTDQSAKPKKVIKSSKSAKEKWRLEQSQKYAKRR